MKKFWTLLLLLIGFSGVTVTQGQINININFDKQPQWGPAGYQAARYYYLPALNIYYDVNNSQYIYLNKNAWKKSRTLPARYRGYDLYSSYKVVINEKNPWKKNNYYASNYGHYKSNHSQVAIKYAKGHQKNGKVGYDRPKNAPRNPGRKNVDTREIKRKDSNHRGDNTAHPSNGRTQYGADRNHQNNR